MRIRMGTFLAWTIALGSLALFIAALTLVCLNWSPKTITPVASILLVGIATTLVTVGIPLKETSISSLFTTNVVLDTRNGRPPFEVTPTPPGKPNEQLSELFRLAQPTVTNDGKAVPTTADPKDDGERMAFACELIQYRIVRVIQELQRGRMQSGFFYGKSLATVTAPIKTSDSVDYPPAELLPAIATNRFSKSDGENLHWRSVGFPVPRKTKLRVSLPSANGGRYTLVLEKPLFFQATFTIEALPYLSAGPLPNGLVIRPEAVQYCQTYHFRVSMRAVFDKLTSGNSRTEEYKDWVNKLFDGIRDKLGD
jgi:hypothetical protein